LNSACAWIDSPSSVRGQMTKRATFARGARANAEGITLFGIVNCAAATPAHVGVCEGKSEGKEPR